MLGEINSLCKSQNSDMKVHNGVSVGEKRRPLTKI